MDEVPILLDNLKSTVECLSISSQTNTWEVCGGLERLFSIMTNIFRHGCLSVDSNVSKYKNYGRVKKLHIDILYKN